MCAVAGWSVKLGFGGREVNMVNRFVSAEEFLLEGGFLSSIEFFQVTSSFHLCHLYECNALSVKNVERHITVWWSKA